MVDRAYFELSLDLFYFCNLQWGGGAGDYICWVLMKLFEHEVARYLANVNAVKQTCHHYSCILPDSSLKSHRKRGKVIKIIVFRTKWHRLAKSNVKDILSTNSVDFNKSIDKKLIRDHNILLCNIMQTNLGPS